MRMKMDNVIIAIALLCSTPYQVQKGISFEIRDYKDIVKCQKEYINCVTNDTGFKSLAFTLSDCILKLNK